MKRTRSIYLGGGLLVLAIVVARHEDAGCGTSRPPDREGMWFQTVEGRLDFHPPKEDVEPGEIDVVIDVVIDVGPVPASEADWGWLESHVAALGVDRSDTLVLVNPSKDAPWDATVRVLAAAAAGGAGQVLFADPSMDAFEGGVMWNGRPLPGGDVEDEPTPPAGSPPSRRVLGVRK